MLKVDLALQLFLNGKKRTFIYLTWVIFFKLDKSFFEKLPIIYNQVYNYFSNVFSLKRSMRILTRHFSVILLDKETTSVTSKDTLRVEIWILSYGSSYWQMKLNAGNGYRF